ncbi:hypothetical protein BJX65DRAFT_78151 [Aspergillus insuetus]
MNKLRCDTTVQATYQCRGIRTSTRSIFRGHPVLFFHSLGVSNKKSNVATYSGRMPAQHVSCKQVQRAGSRASCHFRLSCDTAEGSGEIHRTRQRSIIVGSLSFLMVLGRGVGFLSLPASF